MPYIYKYCPHVNNLCHLVNKTFLTCLSDALGLQPGRRFEDYHRDNKRSTTTLALLHYPKQDCEAGMNHNKHTDIGSLTLLFSGQWGLQLHDWAYVAPQDGHAVVNVGGSLRFLSGKKFNSCLHRMVPVANDEDRYSIAYFLVRRMMYNMKAQMGKKSRLKNGMMTSMSCWVSHMKSR